MPLFTSTRERRLWPLTLAVVVAIFSTLSLTRPLAGALRARGLLEPAFAVAMLLVIVAIVAVGLKTRRPGRLEIGVAVGVAAVYLLVFVRMAIPEERTHLIEYGVVAVLIYEALTERARNGRHVPAPALLAIVTTGLFGILDEVIQAFLPRRVFDPRDILFNVLAGALAVAAIVALRWARRRRR